MAYGYYCTKCKGNVDGNEFDFGRGICMECIADIEKKKNLNEKIEKMMHGEFRQMVLEGVLV